MKSRTLTGLAALTLFDIAAAHAQPAPVFNWTGAYIGIHAGYRWGHVETNLPVAGFPPIDFDGDSFGITGPVPFQNFPVTQHPNSFIWGVHAGFNNQFAPTWLVGVEADWTWGRGRSRFFVGPEQRVEGGVTYETRLGWSATLRGRFGYVANNWLFYGTGGLALQRFSLRGSGSFDVNFAGDSFSVATNFATNRTLFGWVVGAGIEHHFGDNWTWRVEYLYADFGRVNVGSATGSAALFADFDSFSSGSYPVSVKVYTQTIRFGLTKLFSTP